MRAIKNKSITIVFFLLGVYITCLLCNYHDRFKEIDIAYKSNKAINLTKGIKPDSLAHILHLNYYIDDNDAYFIAKNIVDDLNLRDISSLSELKSYRWQVSSRRVKESQSNLFKQLLDESEKAIGIDSVYSSLNIESLTSRINIDSLHIGQIKVRVVCNETGKGCPNVVVRLQSHYIDTIDNTTFYPRHKLIAYAKTNNKGIVLFDGLDDELSYSVLPIQPGYEFGSSCGTTAGSLVKSNKKGQESYEFKRLEHRIKLFDNELLKQIASDGSITIRTPHKYKIIRILQ